MIRTMLIAGTLSTCVGLPVLAQKAEPTDREGVLRLVPSAEPVEDAEFANPTDLVAAVLDGTNAFRRKHERTPLKTNAELEKAAQAFADFMAKELLYGHHADERAPAERAKAAGYDYCRVLENIAYLFDPEGVSKENGGQRFVDMWIESPGHRENMLDGSVTEIGLGMAFDERTHTYFGVQLFGRPKSAKLLFELLNRTNEVVAYELGGERHEVKPDYRMKHELCRVGLTIALVVDDEDSKPKRVAIEDGLELVIVEENDRPVLKRPASSSDD